jgi:UDP-N-acetylglucosamine 2-epimerase (non-hydrolysing)
MAKTALIVGTRPEAIKMMPIYHLLREDPNTSECLISTGQHKEMLSQIFDFFDVKPDLELDVMKDNQTLSGLTSKLFDKLEKALMNTRPDYILVQGDTTTAFVGAMVGFYLKIKVLHVEAGLRTYDRFSPFPEEVNRTLISQLADYHFAPTQRAFDALQNAGFNNVHLTGNTVIDSAELCYSLIEKNLGSYKSRFQHLMNNKNIALLTGHRRESFGSGFKNICNSILDLSADYPNFNFVYPVHLNPNVRGVVHDMLGNTPNIKLIEPLPYDDLVFLMSISKIILTDSGGIQEEAPSFNIPVIVLRDKTERPEGVEAGCSVLAGTDRGQIKTLFHQIIDDPEKYQSMSMTKNPYGDGLASKRIVGYVTNEG